MMKIGDNHNEASVLKSPFYKGRFRGILLMRTTPNPRQRGTVATFRKEVSKFYFRTK